MLLSKFHGFSRQVLEPNLEESLPFRECLGHMNTYIKSFKIVSEHVHMKADTILRLTQANRIHAITRKKSSGMKNN